MGSYQSSIVCCVGSFSGELVTGRNPQRCRRLLGKPALWFGGGPCTKNQHRLYALQDALSTVRCKVLSFPEARHSGEPWGKFVLGCLDPIFLFDSNREATVLIFVCVKLAGRRQQAGAKWDAWSQVRGTRQRFATP